MRTAHFWYNVAASTVTHKRNDKMKAHGTQLLGSHRPLWKPSAPSSWPRSCEVLAAARKSCRRFQPLDMTWKRSRSSKNMKELRRARIDGHCKHKKTLCMLFWTWTSNLAPRHHIYIYILILLCKAGPIKSPADECRIHTRAQIIVNYWDQPPNKTFGIKTRPSW